jgi:DNA-binding NtrC family response regulator
MTGTAPTILVVDDEETIRESLQMFLEAQGWIVIPAESAEQALTILDRQPCDGGIADIRLPGRSGDALVTEAHASQPDMKWIIFTGSMDFRLGPELLAIGLSPRDVFAKPLGDMGLLVTRLRELLAGNAS